CRSPPPSPARPALPLVSGLRLTPFETRRCWHSMASDAEQRETPTPRVNCSPDVVALVAELDFARVQAHAQADLQAAGPDLCGYGQLKGEGAGESIRSVGEGGHETITFPPARSGGPRRAVPQPP